MTHYIEFKSPKSEWENDELIFRRMKHRMGFLACFFSDVDILFGWEDFVINQATVQIKIDLPLLESN